MQLRRRYYRSPLDALLPASTALILPGKPLAPRTRPALGNQFPAAVSPVSTGKSSVAPSRIQAVDPAPTEKFPATLTPRVMVAPAPAGKFPAMIVPTTGFIASFVGEDPGVSGSDGGGRLGAIGKVHGGSSSGGWRPSGIRGPSAFYGVLDGSRSPSSDHTRAGLERESCSRERDKPPV